MNESRCSKSGTYTIENVKNGRFYLGSTKNLKKRKADHFRLLNSGKHTNSYLQADWNKHSPEDFVFKVLTRTSVSKILHEEQTLLDEFYDHQKLCYNFCVTAGSTEGIKKGPMSDSQKQKISSALKGKPKPESYKIKLSKRMKGMVGALHPAFGRNHSEESKLKMSEAKLGRRLSEKTKNKMSSNHPNKKSIVARRAGFEKHFSSLAEAAKELNLHQANISAVLSGRYKHTGGWFFDTKRKNR